LARAGDDFEGAIVADVAYCDEDTSGKGFGIGVPLADDCIGSAIIDFNMGCATGPCAGN
jgi:hypothetical protein